jgi:hypothetical protein
MWERARARANSETVECIAKHNVHDTEARNATPGGQSE